MSIMRDLLRSLSADNLKRVSEDKEMLKDAEFREALRELSGKQIYNLKSKYMSVTILEALQNAEMNFENVKRVGTGILPLAQEQLHNAVSLLEKGYSVEDEVEPLLEKYGSVEDVPDKELL